MTEENENPKKEAIVETSDVPDESDEWDEYDYDEPSEQDEEYWHEDIDYERGEATTEALRQADNERFKQDVLGLLQARGGIVSDEAIAEHEKLVEIQGYEDRIAEAERRGDHENVHRYKQYTEMAVDELKKIPNPRIDNAQKKLAADMEDLITTAAEDTTLDWNQPRLQSDCKAMVDSYNRTSPGDYVYIIKQPNQYDKEMRTSFKDGFSGQDIIKVKLRNGMTAHQFSREARDRKLSVMEYAYRKNLLPKTYETDATTGIPGTDDPNLMTMDDYEKWRAKHGGLRPRTGGNWLKSIMPASERAKRTTRG